LMGAMWSLNGLLGSLLDREQRLWAQLALLVVALLGAWLLLLRKPEEAKQVAKNGDFQIDDDKEELVDRDHQTQTANSDFCDLESVFIPVTGEVMKCNQGEAYEFENDLASGLLLPLHRPTHDPALDRSGNYPYGYHFAPSEVVGDSCPDETQERTRSCT